MRRKILMPILVLVLMFSGLQPSFASDAGNPVIRLNGVQLGVKAVVRGEELYLPVRAICEALDYQVAWSQAEKTVGIRSEEKEITLYTKDAMVQTNGHRYNLMNVHESVNGRTYLSEVFFSDDLALKCQWDKANRIVALSSVKENAISVKAARIDSETKALKTTVQYPVIGGLGEASVQNSLNALFKDLATQAVKTGEESAAELAPYLRKNPDMPGQCETCFDYRIRYNQNGYLSVVFSDYQYAGGAHGSTWQTAFTVLLETGKPLRLSELFNADAAYRGIFDKSVRQQLDQRELTQALAAPFAGIAENQAFFLADTGVAVFYQQSEILPYVAGIQEFTVPFPLFAGMLRDQGLQKENMDGEKMANVMLNALDDRTVLNKSVEWPVMNVGESFDIRLKGNSTTGYSWNVISEENAAVRLVSEESLPDSEMIGSGSTFTWNFKAMKAGKATITFKYYRPWDGEASTLPEDVITFNMTVR